MLSYEMPPVVASEPVPVTPTVAEVTIPSGWPVPVPVVKCWLRMRPTRSPSLRGSQVFMSIALSCSNCSDTRTSLLVYM
jgi:hypothetical protein